MEIINSIWEKRNLGCDSVEIRCSYDDTSLDKSLLLLKQPYQVIKIPCSKTDLLLQAQAFGFVFMECQVQFKTELKDLYLPKKYERLVKNVSYHDASDEEIEETIEKVRNGNMFTTDRIALDPYFSKEIAGKRYANWMNDLLQNGYNVYIYTYKEEPFAWIIADVKENQMADMIFGGNFQEKSWVGMGIAGHYATIKMARDKGALGLFYGVSTNNLRQIKTVLEFGSKINEIEYVLVKHIKEKW